ncbi:3-dehydroquinate synthase [Collinsella sp. An2]|uniref:3-dehydroquinate synthase n=1 Tax=Collinsella sp. An2 TaxID=1965585 RepID=UPI001EF60D3D|nr:3-dehydroquinate synthase [Collinsella sp. An2]
MQTIRVSTGRPYTVHVGTRLLEQAGEMIREACSGAKAMIVTDSNVGPLYASIVQKSLVEAGYDVAVHTFPAGEEHKRAATLIDILEDMAAHEFTREDVVVALGGGVVGDVAGLAAATYMRGCKLAQMPTSLLAMVDSSVGGKTAIDLEGGKNLAGAFWQPWVVLADVGCLGTLTPEQFADGCGEVIKHGVIRDPELFEFLEETPLTYELLLQSLSTVERIVARNVAIKRDVVQADERESNLRKLLNFGHSIGHAVEAGEQYRLGHGTCVAIGMTMISRAAATRGICSEDVPRRIDALCRRHGLDTACGRTVEEIYAAALHDKKRRGGHIDLVIPRAIGDCVIVTTPLDEFRAFIEDGLAVTAEQQDSPVEVDA